MPIFDVLERPGTTAVLQAGEKKEKMTSTTDGLYSRIS